MTKKEAFKNAKHELENARNILEKIKETDKDKNYVLMTIEFLIIILSEVSS